MKQFYYLISCAICLILAHQQMNAQVMYTSQEWYSTGGQSSSINRTVSVVDNNYNVIVVSNKLLPNNTTDVYIKKYNRKGVLLWQQTYNGTGNGNDYGVQVVVNNVNEIFIAAALSNTSNIDFGLLKYTENGTLLWASVWNGTNDGMDIPSDLVLDDTGNIYLTGGSQAANLFSDIAVVKFNSVGAFQWHTGYDYANLHDAATNIDYANGIIYVTGASASSINNWDYITLKITPSSGNIVSDARIPVPGVGFDNALDITTDANNNIYITGYTESNGSKDIQTVKIDDEFGLVWVQNFDGGNNLDDVANSIQVDDNGNVYLTGYSDSPTGNEMLTIKYNAQGTLLWKKRYGALINADDAKAVKIALDEFNGVIIAGTVEKNGDKSFALIKYDTNGKTKFVESFNSNDANDEVEALSVKGEHVFVSGKTTLFGIPTITTVKYTIVEKTINYALDSLGNPMYEANDLLVRFDPSALKHDIINKKNFQVGKLDDFLTEDAVNAVRNAVTDVCGTSKCDITVYKLFRRLRTDITSTISRLGDTIPVPDFWATLILEFPPEVDITQAAAELNTIQPTIKYSQYNMVIELLSDANDPLYSSQASLHPVQGYLNSDINIEPAWDYTVGKESVKVGVFDTGIRWSHEDFDIGDAPSDKIRGWDFETDSLLTTISSNQADVNGHGTSCAGIIGALRNNNIGIAGIAGGDLTQTESYGVPLYGMKILVGDNGIFINASPINYVYDAIVTSAMNNDEVDYGYGLHIMNNSWVLANGFAQVNVTDENIELLKEATHFANRAKVTFLAGRGNHYASVMTYPKYPASIDDDWILTIGGTAFGHHHSEAWYGWDLDVSAPYNSNVTHTTGHYGDFSYTYFGGTSSATALTSGVTALLMSYLNSPEDSYQNLAPEDVEAILQMSAEDIEAPGVDIETGYGRVDAGAALAQVDTNQYHLTHYHSLGTSPLSGQNEIGITLQINETYQNTDNIWFYPNTDYKVNIHPYQGYFAHNIPVEDSIVAYWPRHSSSKGFAYYDSTNQVVPRERIQILSLDHDYCFMKSYYYEVFDMDDNFLGWWPSEPTGNNLNYEYTVLTQFDNFSTDINALDFESGEVSIFPNPGIEEQTISVKIAETKKCTIELFDLQGRKVLDVYSGNIIGHKRIKVPLENLKRDMYIYKIALGEELKQVKILKQ